jgi:predicted Rossmann fold nucleotide-binding protein DprA/Smf involved in DNA uptake
MQHFPEAQQASDRKSIMTAPEPLPETLSGAERELAVLVETLALHPDELANRSGRPIAEVLSILGELEIAGIVEQCPGRVFKRAWNRRG